MRGDADAGDLCRRPSDLNERGHGVVVDLAERVEVVEHLRGKLMPTAAVAELHGLHLAALEEVDDGRPSRCRDGLLRVVRGHGVIAEHLMCHRDLSREICAIEIERIRRVGNDLVHVDAGRGQLRAVDPFRDHTTTGASRLCQLQQVPLHIVERDNRTGLEGLLCNRGYRVDDVAIRPSLALQHARRARAEQLGRYVLAVLKLPIERHIFAVLDQDVVCLRRDQSGIALELQKLLLIVIDLVRRLGEGRMLLLERRTGLIEIGDRLGWRARARRLHSRRALLLALGVALPLNRGIARDKVGRKRSIGRTWPGVAGLSAVRAECRRQRRNEARAGVLVCGVVADAHLHVACRPGVRMRGQTQELVGVERGRQIDALSGARIDLVEQFPRRQKEWMVLVERVAVERRQAHPERAGHAPLLFVGLKPLPAGLLHGIMHDGIDEARRVGLIVGVNRFLRALELRSQNVVVGL